MHMKRYNSWKLVKHKRYVLVQSESSTTSRSFSNWNTFIKAYNTTKNMPTITIPKESAAVRYFSHYTVCYIFFGWQKLKNFREICQGKQTILFDLVFRNSFWCSEPWGFWIYRSCTVRLEWLQHQHFCCTHCKFPPGTVTDMFFTKSSTYNSASGLIWSMYWQRRLCNV